MAGWLAGWLAGWAGRQTGRQADRQTGGQAGRQTGKYFRMQAGQCSRLSKHLKEWRSDHILKSLRVSTCSTVDHAVKLSVVNLRHQVPMST